MRTKILIIEDDSFHSLPLKEALKQSSQKDACDFVITLAEDKNEAATLLKNNSFDLAFIDLNLSSVGGEGLDLLDKYRNQISYPVILTSNDGSEVISRAIENGVKSYLLKPINKDKLQNILTKYRTFENTLHDQDLIRSKFITENKFMLDQLYQIPNFRTSNNPIFISGPSGSGKQLIAEIVRDLIRPKGNFVEFNCSNTEQIEAKLFGSKKGTFTGVGSNKGLIEMAHGGVLFLDEISKMPLNYQANLLKVIEQKKFQLYGEEKEISSDFLLVSACWENLDELVRKGKFLEDLRFRLEGNIVRISPVKERPEDIIPIFKHLMKTTGFVIHPSDEGWKRLKKLNWHGNVRTLKSVFDNWVSLGKIEITSEDIDKLEEDDFKKSYNVLSEELIRLFSMNGHQNTMAQIRHELYRYYDKKLGARKSIEELGVSGNTFYKYRDMDVKDFKSA